MIVPDVNLLLYAEIDANPEHEPSRRWWQSALSGNTSVGIPAVSAFGFIRIATNRRVFVDPLPISDAIERVEAWFARANVTFLLPGPRHLDIAFRLLNRLGTGGNLTTDVQIAAHAIENQGEVYSNDPDFGRFDGLQWRNPLATRRR